MLPRQEPASTQSDQTPQGSDTPGATSAAETSAAPTTRASNPPSQTRSATSVQEQETTTRQSTTRAPTTSSPQPTSTPDASSETSAPTSSQQTSTQDVQTSSAQTETSTTVPTRTDSTTAPTQSPTESATSQGASPSSSTNIVSSKSNTQTPTSSAPLPSSSANPSLPSSTLPITTAPTHNSSVRSSTNRVASSVPPTTTATPPPTTTSDHETINSVTSIVSTVISSVNGQLTTFTTLVPSLASAPNTSSGLSGRTSGIVGGVVGGTLALLGILLALFYFSRRRRKVEAARKAPRLQAPRQMLDTDDFDLAEPQGPAPYAYGVVGARANPNASGSIFHEDLPATVTHPSHGHSQSIVSESDPLMPQHMRGGYTDAESTAASSPRESTHFRASSTTGLLYDPNDPFSDRHSDGGSISRIHPAALAKAREARSRGSESYAYPPSAYHGPVRPESEVFPMHPIGSGVVVHQDAGRLDLGETPPGYTNSGRPNQSS